MLAPASFDAAQPTAFYLLGGLKRLESLSDATLVVADVELPVHSQVGRRIFSSNASSRATWAPMQRSHGLPTTDLHTITNLPAASRLQVLSLQSKVLLDMFTTVGVSEESTSSNKEKVWLG